MPKACCVTGHRNIPADQVEFVKDELRKLICTAIQDGFTRFLSGMAEGVDLYFAEIVVEMKKENTAITLEAAIPYRKRLEAKDKNFQRLIKLCDNVHVSAEVYSKSTFMARNMYMVNESERVIAVHDGREGGGTAFTIRFAKQKSRELCVIGI